MKRFFGWVLVLALLVTLGGAVNASSLVTNHSIAPSAGNTYYVDRNHPLADDSNPGTEDLPWLTIQHAADAVSAGDRAIVKTGNYGEKVVVTTSGESDDYITFQAFGEVTTTQFYLDGSDYIRVDGFRLTGPGVVYQGYVQIEDADHCEIINNVIFDGNTDAHGVKTRGDYYTLIRGNTFDNLKYAHICKGGYYGTIENNTLRNSEGPDAIIIWGHDHTIRGNYFYRINQDATSHTDLFQTWGPTHSYNILVENNYAKDCISQIGNFSQDSQEDVRDWTFRNNIFENISQSTNIAAPGFKFYNNIFYKCTRNTYAVLRFFSYGDSGGTGNNGVVKNNFFIGCGSYGGDDDRYGWYGQEAGVTGLDASHNYVAKSEASSWGAKSGFSGEGGSGINGGDPKWVDYGNGDFHLRFDSPAVDRGTVIAGFSNDKEGISRPQGCCWDIGPYEFVPTLILHGAPANQAIRLTWVVNLTLPVMSTWQIDYEGPVGDQTPPITGIVSPTRSYTLTGLTNYVWYTVTLGAMLDSAPLLTDTVYVMPTDIAIYLPLVWRTR